MCEPKGGDVAGNEYGVRCELCLFWVALDENRMTGECKLTYSDDGQAVAASNAVALAKVGTARLATRGWFWCSQFEQSPAVVEMVAREMAGK